MGRNKNLMPQMKPKYLLLGIAGLVAAGGLWLGRLAWRAHRQLVTLDVHEAPLPQVLRDIERQTWTKIREEAALDTARITLHVEDAPLAQVLSRIAEQAGARWSTLYAVYNSRQSLKALESALSGDGKLGAAGWTTLAPKLPPPESLPPDKPVIMNGQGGPPPPGHGPGMLMMRRSKGGPVVFMGGPGGKTEAWSPEELLAESSLSSRIGAGDSLTPTAATAAQAARKVNGRWTTFLAFSKSEMGVGFRMPPTPPPPGPNQPVFGQAMRLPDPNERFENLTPEQRVEQARQRRNFHVQSALPPP